MTSPTLVTGGSGFLGRILVRQLVESGRRVRVLERRPSDAFEGLDVERARGDVTDRPSVDAAMRGVDSVFNLAGVVSHLERDRDLLMAVNVRGARNIVGAARAAGVRRLLHVASVASVGFPDDPAKPLDEDSPYPEAARAYPYSLSKRLGEEAVLEPAEGELEVVVVNPGFVIGPGDVNRVSTFAMEQYLRGLLRTTLPGGLHYVDARDVVDGALRAEASGQPGRRYILGTPDGNLSHRDFFHLVGRIDGKRRLTVHLPAAVVLPSARVMHKLHLPLPVEPDELASSRHYWYVSPQHAIDELGLKPRPVRDSVADTIAYLRERGLSGR